MIQYLDFTGRIVLITGASSGLGRAYAIAFAERGAKVAAFARQEEKLLTLKYEIASLGSKCLLVVCDVTKEQDIIDGVRKTIEHFGKIDILINNAGNIKVCPTTESSLDDRNSMVNTSITAYYLMAREVGKNMIANRYGRIINTASMYGCIAAHHMTVSRAAQPWL